MKSSSENQIVGKVHEAKGKIKEEAGRLTTDPGLEAEASGKR